MTAATRDDTPNIGEKIDGLGWRTGTACSRTALLAFPDWIPPWISARVKSAPDGLWVPYVVSQSCDLVCDTLDQEPFAEMILGRLRMPPDPNLGARKTYRRLQLNHQSEPYAEFRVQDRWSVDRNLLLTVPREPELDLTWAKGVELGGWIGGRYSRLPLPNELVNRMNTRGTTVRRYFKALNTDISEIRVQVTPSDRDLPEGTPYLIVMYVITTVTAFKTKASQEAYDKLEEWLKALPGVNVQLRLRSPDKFSYAEFCDTYRLDLDMFTFGHLSGPAGALPASQ